MRSPCRPHSRSRHGAVTGLDVRHPSTQPGRSPVDRAGQRAAARATHWPCVLLGGEACRERARPHPWPSRPRHLFRDVTAARPPVPSTQVLFPTQAAGRWPPAEGEPAPHCPPPPGTCCPSSARGDGLVGAAAERGPPAWGPRRGPAGAGPCPHRGSPLPHGCQPVPEAASRPHPARPSAPWPPGALRAGRPPAASHHVHATTGPAPPRRCGCSQEADGRGQGTRPFADTPLPPSWSLLALLLVRGAGARSSFKRPPASPPPRGAPRPTRQPPATTRPACAGDPSRWPPTSAPHRPQLPSAPRLGACGPCSRPPTRAQAAGQRGRWCDQPAGQG